MKKPEKLNQTEFAVRIGKTKGYVSQLKTAGRLVMDENGKVDVEASLIRIKETEDESRADVTARHAAERLEKNSPAEKTKKVKDPNHVTLSDGKAKEQYFKALLSEIEYKKTIGDLVSKEDMRAAVADLVTTFRQEIENLPHRISADLVGKDINEIRTVLKHSVHASLANLERGCSTKLNQQTEVA